MNEKALREAIREGEAAASRFAAEAAAAIEKAAGRKIWKLSADDVARMQKLRVWSERSSASLEWMAASLAAPLAEAARKRGAKGLGFRMASLCGPASEARLEEALARDFPDAENRRAEKEKRAEAAVRALAAREKKTRKARKARDPLSHATAEAFAEAYAADAESDRREWDEASRKLAKWPFRGNPFR